MVLKKKLCLKGILIIKINIIKVKKLLQTLYTWKIYLHVDINWKGTWELLNYYVQKLLIGGRGGNVLHKTNFM